MLQAASCADLGSPMYSRILAALADDHRSGGITARLLVGRGERAVADAIPLRLLGAVHLAVLSGRAPRLAAHYPSVGGSPGPGMMEDFLATLADIGDALANGLNAQVQTNEPGRAVVPLVLINWLGAQGVGALDWLEVGASAGLNLCFTEHSADTGSGVLGSTGTGLHFGPEWFASGPAVSASVPMVIRREGFDPHPIDVHDEDEALRLVSFVWPDQHDRIARLRAAINTARASGVKVHTGSAEHAVGRFLNNGLQRTTVVFHSIVWQYLSTQVKEAFRQALETAGRTTSEGQRLIWARMEPAGPVADVQVDVWDGSGPPRHARLATVGYHGRGLDWFGD